MFNVPDLPYEFNALEPHIDAKTMEIHHDKHHQAYVDKLNAAVKDTEFADMGIKELLTNLDKVPKEKLQAVINHGGGHANHSLFWEILSADGGGKPEGELHQKINEKFGDFDEFKKQFSAAAATVFGSGWAYLIVNSDGELEITAKPNQDSPLMDGATPILGLDVWEHAYYLNYQNKRPAYIEAFWNIVNWSKVEELFSQSK